MPYELKLTIPERAGCSQVVEWWWNCIRPGFYIPF